MLYQALAQLGIYLQKRVQLVQQVQQVQQVHKVFLELQQLKEKQDLLVRKVLLDRQVQLVLLAQ
jgi:chorismate-pyruvate lyase